MDMLSRQKRYYTLHSRLASLSNDALLEKIKAAPHTKGWGLNHTLELDGTSIFVKRIPLTEKEFAQLHDTQNLFDLPMHYHYGMGSAGFGAFREWLTHIKTTDWVLSGEQVHFPLLYHYRILHSQASWKVWDSEKMDGYCTYWNDNGSIREYTQARMEAPYEIALFLEHIPHSLYTWFKAPSFPKFTQLVQEARDALTFLQAQGILHMDAHLANLLTDGEHCYVSDFGLALDRQFAIDQEELAFFETHQDYDQGQLTCCTGLILLSGFEILEKEKQKHILQAFDLPSDTDKNDRNRRFIEELEHLNTGGLELPKEHFRYLQKHRTQILYMMDFYHHLHEDSKKELRFDRNLLKSGKLPEGNQA